MHEQMRSENSDLGGLPDIYGRVRAPLIGRSYPYYSVTDQQNNQIIRKLMNRNLSMEHIGVDGNQILVNLGGGSQISYKNF